LERLGINGGLLLAQLINFGLVAFAIYALAWRPIVRTLEARRERIAKGLEDAAQAEQRLANAEREAQKLLDQRRAEANKLFEEARGRGEEQAKVILEEARRESEAIRAKARQDALEERDAILAGVRTQVAQISVAAAERVIGQSLDERRSHQIVDAFFANVPTGVSNLGGNVEVVSALPLTDAEKAEIRNKTGAQNVSFRVDPSILGGLVIRSGEKVVDGSVRSGLSSLATQIS
jgi:F-type H+-transporting ATPase subunit b